MEVAADSLAELAQAADSPRPRRALNVPAYRGITSGALVLRVLALLAVVVAALLIAGGVVMGIADVKRINDRMRDVGADSRGAEASLTAARSAGRPDDSEFRRWSALERDLDTLYERRIWAIARASGVVVAGVVVAAIAALVRMVAWIGLAVRDAARNSFELHRLAP